MKIDVIKIINWRSIKELEIKFQDITMLIGQNNHGKSNILYAILLFFGEIKTEQHDFFYSADFISIDIEFSNLSEEDKRTFTKYLTPKNKIKVNLRIEKNGNVQYKGYREVPDDERLLESNAAAYTKREIANTLPYATLLPQNGRLSQQDLINAQEQYIRLNRDQIRFNYRLEGNSFLGLTNVAKSIFGQIIFIPAIREISNDMTVTKTSPFGMLFSKIIEDISLNYEKWSTAEVAMKELFDSINKYSSTGEENLVRPNKLLELETELSTELSEWGCSVDLELSKPNVYDFIKGGVNLCVSDGIRTTINRKGHGLQRAVMFALMKTINKLLNSQVDTATGGRQSSKSIYYVLEEPELYLHPQAQRMLLDSLNKISENNQVILCTHSSHLLSLEMYKSIVIAKKSSSIEGTKVSQYVDDIFIDNEKDEFNLCYWINPDRSELFFAKRVILVEGETDKTVIPFLAKKINVYKYDYTVIDCGSKNNIPLYMKLLNKFRINYVAIYDKDHQSHKNADAINSANTSTQKIIDVLDSSIGKLVEFVNDIEEELGYPAGKKEKGFMAIKFIQDSLFSFKSELQEKINIIYQ